MGKMTILHSFTVIQNVVVVKRGKAEAFCWLCQMCSVWVQAFAFSMQPPQHLDFAYEWLSGGFGRSPTLNCARPQNFAVLAKQRISRSFTSWILRTSRFKMAIMDAANYCLPSSSQGGKRQLKCFPNSNGSCLSFFCWPMFENIETLQNQNSSSFKHDGEANSQQMALK